MVWVLLGFLGWGSLCKHKRITLGKKWCLNHACLFGLIESGKNGIIETSNNKSYNGTYPFHSLVMICDINNLLLLTTHQSSQIESQSTNQPRLGHFKVEMGRRVDEGKMALQHCSSPDIPTFLCFIVFLAPNSISGC